MRCDYSIYPSILYAGVPFITPTFSASAPFISPRVDKVDLQDCVRKRDAVLFLCHHFIATTAVPLSLYSQPSAEGGRQRNASLDKRFCSHVFKYTQTASEMSAIRASQYFSHSVQGEKLVLSEF